MTPKPAKECWQGRQQISQQIFAAAETADMGKFEKALLLKAR
jgi:hypothetical protein